MEEQWKGSLYNAAESRVGVDAKVGAMSRPLNNDFPAEYCDACE